MGFGNQKEEKAPVMKSDLKYIHCQSCETVIREANRGMKKMRNEEKPGKKASGGILHAGQVVDFVQVTETDVFAFLEKICNPDSDEGEWITMIDLVETGPELKFVDMETPGFCGTECRTIARACTDLIEEIDYELAEALFKGVQQRAALTQRFCREATSACVRKPPDLPKDRPEGPPFVPMSEEDYRMAKMMQQMKDMGLGGQVFDQDSARDFIAQQGGYGSDEEDEDEDYEQPLVALHRHYLQLVNICYRGLMWSRHPDIRLPKRRAG